MGRLVLLCRDLYFGLPCVKYSKAGGWEYYHDVLGIKISPVEKELSFPRWYIPCIQKIDNCVSHMLITYMKRNKGILKKEYYGNK